MSNSLRYLETVIKKDALAAHKIAFISGPRQVGKTTMVRSIFASAGQAENYYSWDDDEFRALWLRSPKPLMEAKPEGGIFVFDEIHKHRAWKNKLKGLYDLYHEKHRFMVTGSARLDFYRKSGDSLQGRYFPYRLHPFTCGESDFIKPPPRTNWENAAQENFSLKNLEKFGGFPEPFLSQSEAKAARWRRLHLLHNFFRPHLLLLLHHPPLLYYQIDLPIFHLV
jgi:predicted AAA+ superfamily ATPase